MELQRKNKERKKRKEKGVGESGGGAHKKKINAMENHKLPSQLSMLGRHRPASETPSNDVSLVG